MLNYTKKAEIADAIAKEQGIVSNYVDYENKNKETIKTYLTELKSVSFDNDALKTMIINNFENAVSQIDNNLLDIDSLKNVLDILTNQKNVTIDDFETYNKLATKTIKDMELTQNFIQKTIGCFENVTMNVKKKSIEVLDDCKNILLADFPFAEDITKCNKKTSNDDKKHSSKTIKKDVDFSTSDLLCFFPKNKDDNLVLSTIQNNYKISFSNKTASIIIEEENFNMSLVTHGVQISNSNTNNILFVSQKDGIYTIITNNQIEIPPFIHICKVSKNDDFLEIEVTCNSICLNVEENILNFIDENTNTAVDSEMIAYTPSVKTIENSEKKDSIISSNIVKSNDEVKPSIREDNLDNSEIEKDEEINDGTTAISAEDILEEVPVSLPGVEEIQEEEDKNTIDSFPAVAAASILENLEQPVIQETPAKKSSKAKHAADPKGKKEIGYKVHETTEELSDNDTLIISDPYKKVILPYKVEDLEKKLEKNKKYKSIKDVLENEYIIPLDAFKDPVKSRFREAFQLIKKKEHGSLKEAVGLGFELMFQSNLNPAIIAACKDLDELDIYLDCLDDNELEKFDCFKIFYSVPPSSKGKNK